MKTLTLLLGRPVTVEFRPKGDTFVGLYRDRDGMTCAGGRIAATSGDYKVARIAGAGT